MLARLFRYPVALQTLKLWDITTGMCIRTMRGHLAGVNTVAVLADGRAVSGGLDRCADARLASHPSELTSLST